MKLAKIYLGREVFKAKATARAKTLELYHFWNAEETSKRLMWMEKRSQRGNGSDPVQP